MPQTIRLTLTPDLEKSLNVLRQSTMGTLNTTEIIKMAVGSFAKQKLSDSKIQNAEDISPEKLDEISANLFYQWAKEDGTLHANNISPRAKLKPFTPEPYVSNR